MRSTLLVALVAIGLAVLFGVEGNTYPQEARRLPVLLAGLVGFLAVLMIVEEMWKARRRRPLVAPEPVNGEAVDPGMPPVVWSALVPFAVAIAAYVALIPIAGYLITTPTFLAGALLVSRTVRPLTAVLVAGAVTGGIWLVFIWLLRLPVPLLPSL